MARRRSPRSSAAGSSSRSRSRWPFPESTTGGTPPAALEALTRVGVEPDAAEAALASFTGADRRFQLVGERGGVTVVDDYGHNPTEIRAALETARGRADGRVVALYVPHVVERTRHLHRELGDALSLADVAIVTDFVGRRDALREDVSGPHGPRRRAATRRVGSGRRRSTTRRRSPSPSSARATSS